MNHVPLDSASFIWLSTMSPARRQQLDERIQLATREAMRNDAESSVTVTIKITPNVEQARAELGSTFAVALPKLTGASSPVSVFAETGDIAEFGERVSSGKKPKLAQVHPINE